MKRAIYPGSFDPVTFGHLDIIRRSSKMVDELVVGVLNNKAKNPLFTAEERMELLIRATSDLPNIKVTTFGGLLIDFAIQEKADMIIRGLRAITDFEYELQMAQTNHSLCSEIDTVFLTTAVEYSYLSSSTVREIASFGGNISKFVPEFVAEEVLHKYGYV